jgi:hypothetical protein
MSDQLPTAARVSDPGIRALFRQENRFQAWLIARRPWRCYPKAATLFACRKSASGHRRAGIAGALSVCCSINKRTAPCPAASAPAHDGAAVRHNGAGGEIAPFPDLPAFVRDGQGWQWVLPV